MSRSIICWTPRILTLCFALYLGLFAVDVFNEKLSLRQTATALAIHLIPTAIVLLVMAIAWRWEWVGALIFAAAAVIYSMQVLPMHPAWAAAIALPLLVIAALYLLAWMHHRSEKMAH